MTETFGHTKEMIKAREKARMDVELESGEWSQKDLKSKVALTCRILFDEGHDSGLAGQITARVEDDTYLTQRLGLGFDEISVSNLLKVDRDLQVIEGEGMPNPANRFHSWIYNARPDVNCIIHTHPLYTSALSMLEKPLIVSHMDACILYGEVAFIPHWPGVPVGNEEGSFICEALGDKSALLLSHHGLVAVGASVEEACVIALQFEKAAKIQMLAMSAGDIKPIDKELGKEAHDWLLRRKRIEATYSYYSRRLLKKGSDCLV